MTIRLRTFFLSFAIGSLILPMHASALRIEGMPLEALSVRNVEVKVEAGKLQVSLPDGRHVSVGPWPAFLPQQFGRQTARIERQVLPAGPSDRIALARASEMRDWLVVGNGSRRAATVVGNWKLQFSNGDWYVVDGTRTKKLGTARPTQLAVGSERWCVYLLESRPFKAQPGLAIEREAQLAWAAVRMQAQQKQCRK
jgi:hypothetical protein